jgi:hypothetical protein
MEASSMFAVTITQAGARLAWRRRPRRRSHGRSTHCFGTATRHVRNHREPHSTFRYVGWRIPKYHPLPDELRQRYVRVVNHTDTVVDTALFCEHARRLWYFDTAGRLHHQKSFRRALGDMLAANRKLGGLYMFSAHDMKQYLPLLEAQAWLRRRRNRSSGRDAKAWVDSPSAARRAKDGGVDGTRTRGLRRDRPLG